MPKFWPLMEELFETISVDGSTSTIPGYNGSPFYRGGSSESNRSPKSASTLGKRSMSTADTASSPSKDRLAKKASTVAGRLELFLGKLEEVSHAEQESFGAMSASLIAYWQNRHEDTKKEKEELHNAGEECMKVVAELGIPRNSVEWHRAQKCFSKAANIRNFQSCLSDSERRNFLKAHKVM